MVVAVLGIRTHMYNIYTSDIFGEVTLRYTCYTRWAMYSLKGSATALPKNEANRMLRAAQAKQAGRHAALQAGRQQAFSVAQGAPERPLVTR